MFIVTGDSIGIIDSSDHSTVKMRNQKIRY